MPTTSPCRLYVFLARSAPIAVILRRGPSRWVQMIKWRTDTDEFTSGQWIHAQVYEKDCEISGDGNYFRSSVRQESVQSLEDMEVGSCWDAISRPPYFTALAVHGASGKWIYRFGLPPESIVKTALFSGERTSFYDFANTPPKEWMCLQSFEGEYRESPTQKIISDQAKNGSNVEYQALSKLIASLSGEERRIKSGYITYQPGVFQKKSGSSSHILQIRLTRTENHWSPAYSVLASGIEHRLPGVTCADWDHNGRLIYSKSGKLFASTISELGLECVAELADFNENKPEQVQPPDWSTQWVRGT